MPLLNKSLVWHKEIRHLIGKDLDNEFVLASADELQVNSLHHLNSLGVVAGVRPKLLDEFDRSSRWEESLNFQHFAKHERLRGYAFL